MKLFSPILALLLLACSATIQPAQAAAPTSPPHARDAEPLETEGAEEGEAGEEECEEGEAEAEEEACEEEEDEFEVAGGTVYLPAECLLRSAEPTVSAQGHSLHLTLRYTADAPTKLGVEYWLKGGKGSLRLGSQTQRVGEHGVLRLNRHLSDREAAKVRAARAFVLALRVPGASPDCSRFLTLRLTSKHLRGARATWSE